MELTSTHGIILAAIGLAMFAILAVVWVLWRRRGATKLPKEPEPEREASPREVWLWNEHGIFLGSDGKWWMIEGPGARPLPDDELDEYGLRAPYAPITGTGSRPVNPLEERVAALEDALRNTNGRVGCLENKSIRSKNLRAREARLDALESKRDGEGLRVFGDHSGPVYLLANGVIWGVNSWNVSAWNWSGIARFLRSWADRELPPTDPRHAEVVASWREREGA